MPPELWFLLPGDPETRTGGYAYDRRLAAGLRLLGWSVHVVGLPAAYPFPGPADRSAAAAALAALPDGALTLVDGLAFGAMPAEAAAESRRLRLAALVHHPLALESGLAPATAAALAAGERAALAAARLTIATSRSTAATLAADYGVTAVVAPPGTDPAPPALGSAPPRLLSVGTLTPRKDHRTLLRALARIAGRRWSCRIVGATDRAPAEAAAIAAMIGDLPVSLAGELADLEPDWRAADIFVLPSRHEGFGMAAAEALVRGLPVVACAAGAVPEVVPPSAGILVPPGDDAALAAALAGLLDDPARRRDLARGAREAGAALPGWHDTARIADAALRRLAGEVR